MALCARKWLPHEDDVIIDHITKSPLQSHLPYMMVYARPLPSWVDHSRAWRLATRG